MDMSAVAILVGILIIAAVAFVAYREIVVPAKSETSDTEGTKLLDVAVQAHKEGLGLFAKLLTVASRNDLPGILAELLHLGRLLREGSSFTVILADFVDYAIRQRMADPVKRAELLALIRASTPPTA